MDDMMVPVVWWLVREDREVYRCDSCALRAPDAKRCDEREAAREVARATKCDDCGGDL